MGRPCKYESKKKFKTFSISPQAISSIKTLGNKYNISCGEVVERTVRHFFNKEYSGFDLTKITPLPTGHYRKIPLDKCEEILYFYEYGGLTALELSKEYGVSRQAIYDLARRTRDKRKEDTKFLRMII